MGRCRSVRIPTRDLPFLIFVLREILWLVVCHEKEEKNVEEAHDALVPIFLDGDNTDFKLNVVLFILVCVFG